jgi:hypothetical protein
MMDVDALIEEQAKLYNKVKDKCALVFNKPAIQAEVEAVFVSVNNWQMNAAINRQQNERYEKKQQQIDEPPSQAQLRYAEDLRIEIPEGCTKKQLSKLINEAKS